MLENRLESEFNRGKMTVGLYSIMERGIAIEIDIIDVCSRLDEGFQDIRGYFNIFRSVIIVRQLNCSNYMKTYLIISNLRTNNLRYTYMTCSGSLSPSHQLHVEEVQ